MTTALPMNGTQFIAQEFASGSGHVNPLQAINPGLVYEPVKDDYLKLLCNKGYDDQKLRLISGDNTTTCPTDSSKLLPQDVNYPAMATQVLPVKPFTVKFLRSVKNVGLANSTYKVSVFPSMSQINVTVEPEVLSFNSLNEKRSFVATVDGGGNIGAETMLSTSLVWSDGTHTVKSPIIVYVISI